MSKSKSKGWVALAALAVSVMAGPAEAQPYVYALGIEPLSLNQRLNVINAATNTVVAAAVLGETQGTRPEHMVMAPDGGRIYVINSLDFNVSVVSTQTHALVDTWPQSLVGNSPQGLAVSPDSRRLYVTSLDVVNNKLEGSLVVIDIASKSRLATIPFGLNNTYGVAASSDGSRLYVVTSTDAGGRAVTVLDAATNGVITETTLSGGAFGTTVSLTPDGRFAYLPRQPNGSQAPGIVDVLDTTTNTIVTTTTVSNNPLSAAVSPNGAIVYVATPTINAGSLHRLDPFTHASLGATALVSPIAVAFRADSSRAYVAAVDKVYVLDTATHAVTTTIPIPSRLLDNSVGNRIAAIVTTPPPSGPSPGAPTLSGSVSGTTANLTWTPSPSGGAPTSYILQAGTVSGESNLFNGNVGLTTTLTSGVGPGTYYVRVRAANDVGISLPSNEVTLTVGGGAPGKPTVTSAIANGGILTVSWLAGAGPVPTSHRLDFYAGAALVATVNAGAGTSIGIPIPPGIQGTFGVRVTARNGSVAGPASELFTFTIGPACTVPASPNVSGGVVGGTASVNWPAVPGATSYTLSAGTVQGGTQYLPPTNIGANTGASASGLPAGFTAWVRVIAVNACGQASVPRDFFVQ